jgi:hydroxymethylbilane synthase
MSSCAKITISVGARDSLLSRKQVVEIAREIALFHPAITFEPYWIKTTGDFDQKTSLRTMEHSDFFTKEIDDMQLMGCFRLSIHSAKDLPCSLRSGLSIAALTKGQDPSDSLVLPERMTLKDLGASPRVATSSLRREAIITSLLPNARLVDIRGTIEKRLEKLASREIDALVVAEAALIRLELTFLNRMRLEGPVAKYQGQLAVVARSDDKEMFEIFSPIDTRGTSVRVWR